MTKTMPYSVYKTYFRDCKASNYNSDKKTIMVLVPDNDKRITRVRHTADWQKINGNWIYNNDDAYHYSIHHNGNIIIYRAVYPTKRGIQWFWDSKDFIAEIDAVNHIINVYDINNF